MGAERSPHQTNIKTFPNPTLFPDLPLMQTLQDPAHAQHYHHGQEPTSASTVVASEHSRQPTAATEVDTPISPTAGKHTYLDYGVSSDGLPSVIPVRTTDHPRTLVVCFDGTGDQFQSDNSNVVKFVSMLSKEDPDKQLVYYQESFSLHYVSSN